MERNLKRKADVDKENCPHGEKCYRRNPHHFKEYEHSHLLKYIENGIPADLPQPKNVYLEQMEVLKDVMKKRTKNEHYLPSTSENVSSSKTETNSDSVQMNNSSGYPSSERCMLDKWNANAPYHIFYTTIPKSPDTLKQKNAVTFTDLLCPSLGKLKSSLQINFMIDIEWLMEQYQIRKVNSLPITIIYGDEFPKMREYMDRFLKQVTHHHFKMKDPFGIHHSKIGIYLYDNNSLRVVVSTANLYYEDWNHYNQGLWLSPVCPPLNGDHSTNDGESPTGFKSDFLNYLKSYKVPCLNSWIEHVQRTDFSRIKVSFVSSIPGKHYPDHQGSHIHTIARLLRKHCNLPPKTTPQSEGPSSWGVIAQSSSIGSLGKTAAEWLRPVILRSLAAHKGASLATNPNATLNFVYPSVDNVINGYFGPESGGCLPYSKDVNEKQKWFQEYLHQWTADRLNRSRAMPHIKSYTRVSPCLTKLAYYLLTSANMSKAAWGGNIQKDQGVYVRSYEAGVLFLPEFFNEEYFEISHTVNNSNEKLFPFMYDLPLTPYKSDDYPWCN